MRYRVEIAFPGWAIELDAANPADALQQVTADLRDHLEDVLLDATITVEAVDEPEEHRGEQED